MRLEEGRGLKFDLEWERAYALSYILFICGDQVDFWSSLDWPRYVEYIEELRKESSAHEAWPVFIHAVHRVCSVRLSIQQDLVSLVLTPETPEYTVHLALGMTPSPPSLPPCLPSPPPFCFAVRMHGFTTDIPVCFERTGFRTWSWNQDVCCQSM